MWRWASPNAASSRNQKSATTVQAGDGRRFLSRARGKWTNVRHLVPVADVIGGAAHCFLDARAGGIVNGLGREFGIRVIRLFTL